MLYRNLKYGGLLPDSGLFITLYDKETLSLYVKSGVYGFLMSPVFGEVSTRSRHYAALADYACTREGVHVFFFLKRMIVYGGQIKGSPDCASFYLNGPYCPLGLVSKASIAWDESTRTRYEASNEPGIFTVPEVGERCQPYLIIFFDELGLKGQAIPSDDLYFELGKYPYPLPSNSIQNMSFCTLTPGETEILLTLLKTDSKNALETIPQDVNFNFEPLPFDTSHGISKLHEATSEAHLEASVLANPELLPEKLRPGDSALCRQVPVSPFKPSQMDRADICYYSDEVLAEGTIPNTIIELKHRRAGKNEISQVVRYLKWLYKVAPMEAPRVSLYLFAPSFSRNISGYIPREYRSQISLVPFSGFEY